MATTYTARLMPGSWRWGVYTSNGTLVEGGFFGSGAAKRAAARWALFGY